jgi:hypothetical protein
MVPKRLGKNLTAAELRPASTRLTVTASLRDLARAIFQLIDQSLGLLRIGKLSQLLAIAANVSRDIASGKFCESQSGLMLLSQARLAAITAG